MKGTIQRLTLKKKFNENFWLKLQVRKFRLFRASKSRLTKKGFGLLFIKWSRRYVFYLYLKKKTFFFQKYKFLEYSEFLRRNIFREFLFFNYKDFFMFYKSYIFFSKKLDDLNADIFLNIFKKIFDANNSLNFWHKNFKLLILFFFLKK